MLQVPYPPRTARLDCHMARFLSSLVPLLVLVALSGCGRSVPSPPPVRSGDRSDSRLSPVVTDRPTDAPEGMVWIPGDVFEMGTRDPASKQDEFPPHKVELDGFYIDVHEVTNAEFDRFVAATGFVTAAEKKPDFQFGA